MAIKKLIEVALPLDKINVSAAYEKMPGIGAHPRGLHLWWARRPFTVARAVIWASLVDDPSSHPELFPTEQEQNKERNRLFKILESLVKWENSDNEYIIAAAREEIMKSTNHNPPALLDPFAGGGAIPLEAYRLGLEAHAHDLNPISVMINKSMIDIPQRFSNIIPVSQRDTLTASSCTGPYAIAEDVLFYGRLMREETARKIGFLYPQVSLPIEQGAPKANVIAYIWARTVKCSNPACGCQVPLISNFVLSKKKGSEAWVSLEFSGSSYRFRMNYGKFDSNAETGTKFKNDRGKGKKATFSCPRCQSGIITGEYIDAEAEAGRMGVIPVAVVAEGKKGKVYLEVDLLEHSEIMRAVEDYYVANKIDDFVPHAACRGTFASNAQGRYYGFHEFKDYFTKRQLITLVTLSQLLDDIRDRIESDAIKAGMANDHIPLEAGGYGALAYAQAVSVYLAFAIDRTADFSTSVSRWAVTNEKAMNCFSKQAISMTWDYPEVNILGNAVGGFSPIVEYIASCIKKLPYGEIRGDARQLDAQSDSGLRSIMVSTDPPYYDNVEYADLSDFFYVWLRANLKSVYPDLFKTMLVPKIEELVATPYKFDGDAKAARDFFEHGMLQTCKRIYEYSREDIPVTIYYAYKQSDTDVVSSETSSTGWETMLSAIIASGFSITGTWPMRTEQTYRAISMGTNALASSIVLVCRKRSLDAAVCTRRNFINELKRELRPALQKLQNSNIAPVDLAQSAIGPGMAVFSKYSQVLEADGSPMTVRSALQIINQELDMYFNEQDGDLDSESRFCVDLYSQFAFNDMKFGDANTLATAKNTSVAIMASHGILYAQKGVVRLIERSALPEKINEREGSIWLLCQQLTYRMEKEGIEGCAKVLATMFTSNADRAKDLAYRLYTIAERKKWSQEAYAYNAIVVAWPEIQSRAAELRAVIPEQMTFFTGD